MRKFNRCRIFIEFFLIIVFIFSPAFSFAQESGIIGTTSIKNILSPEVWFNALRQNVSIPISSTSEVKIPTPEQALKESSPQLQAINKQVVEETGIDFAKFIGWFARALAVFFQIIINLLQNVSKALNPSLQ